MGRLDEYEWEAPDGSEVCDTGDDALTWSRREAARQRQIMIGKARPEYRRYITEVPPERRSSSQPMTPDPRARVSKRQFDRALGEWRRRLHEFDSVPPFYGSCKGPWEQKTQEFERSIASSASSGEHGASGALSGGMAAALGSPSGMGFLGGSPVSRSQRVNQRRNRGFGRGMGMADAGITAADAGPAAGFDQQSSEPVANNGAESVVISLAERLEVLNPMLACAHAHAMPEQQAQCMAANTLAIQQAQQHFEQAQLAQQMLEAAGCGVNPFELTAGMCWSQGYDDSANMAGFAELAPQPWYPETPQKALMGAQPATLFDSAGPDSTMESPEKHAALFRPSAAYTADALAAVHASMLDDCGLFKKAEPNLDDGFGSEDGKEIVAPLSPALRPAQAAWPAPPPLPKSPRTPNAPKAARHQVLRTPNAKDPASFLDELRLNTPVHKTPASLAATPGLPCWALETPSPERVPRYDMRPIMHNRMPLGGLGALPNSFLGDDLRLCQFTHSGFLDGSMLQPTSEFPMTPLAECPIPEYASATMPPLLETAAMAFMGDSQSQS